MTDHRISTFTGLALAFAVLCLAPAAEAREPAAVAPMALSQMVRPAGVPAVPASPAQALEESFDVAQADCASAAAQAAADSGGQVLSVSAREQNGRTVCVVTVLVPGEDGGRPRKKTITIPQ
ncbi:hypothetical protein Sa4125_12460 [Aureimonas sp. SA4125]|uniref:hypothetical protein n=1 Tax=Aureimonas sp. SA4125 TaxID=2826993 RepID=UPI001CC3FF65|nr:hypothetical protein [Aureimonas sp. SA4125]BDA83704.1 hypothetical protein Sa4125_12460 [Aureimonas sp. SA4125]